MTCRILTDEESATDLAYLKEREAHWREAVAESVAFCGADHTLGFLIAAIVNTESTIRHMTIDGVAPTIGTEGGDRRAPGRSPESVVAEGEAPKPLLAPDCRWPFPTGQEGTKP